MRLSTIKLDDADKLGADGEVTGRVTYRRSHTMNQPDYAVRMVIAVDDELRATYHYLDGAIKSRGGRLAFRFEAPSLTGPRVTVAYFDLGQFPSRDRFVPLSKPLSQVVVLHPAEN